MEEEAVEFQTLLGLAKDRHLVGVRFLFSEAEYQEAEGKEATHQMFFCMMVRSANSAMTLLKSGKFNARKRSL